jgi:hypothetical protein
MEDCPHYLTITVPKDIARIKLCGAITFTITDQMEFTKPTPQQIKNLKECFNIEVELLDEYEQL